MTRPPSRKPVAVMLLGRHGRVDTSQTHPLTHEGQGRFTLTPEAVTEAQSAGRQIFNYLVRRGVVQYAKQRGFRINLRPSPYARAVQTAAATSGQIETLLEKSGVTVTRNKQHGLPDDAVGFIHMTEESILPHYPAAGSPEESKMLRLEKQWAQEGSVPGWESKADVTRRTRAVRGRRDELQNEQRVFRRRLHLARIGLPIPRPADALPLSGWVSHGPGREARKLKAASSPLGLALKQFFTRKEKRKFRIPTELVRGEYVAAILYDDGSIHAQHIRPRSAKSARST